MGTVTKGKHGGVRAGAGRPPSPLAEVIRDLAEGHKEKAIAALVGVLDRPDDSSAVVKAASEILDRVAAKPKTEIPAFTVPGIEPGMTLQEKADCVVQAVLSGVIGPEAGRAALAMLGDAARILDTTELQRQIRELQTKFAELKGGKAPRKPRIVEAEPQEELA